MLNTGALMIYDVWLLYINPNASIAPDIWVLNCNTKSWQMREKNDNCYAVATNAPLYIHVSQELCIDPL